MRFSAWLSPALRWALHRTSIALGGVAAAALFTQACGDARERPSFDASNDTADSGARDPSFAKDASALEDVADDATCAGTVVTLERAAVYMLFILDGSGSMLDPLAPNGPTGLKWQAARDAMVSFIDDAEKAHDTAFGVGLFLFDGTQSVADFTATDVGIDYVDATHAGQLRQRIKSSSPQGGTPLKRAIEGQLGILTSFQPYTPLKKNGKRVLVIMTDGVPDGPSDVQPQVQQQCVDLVQAAHDGPSAVTTFAVGVGDPASSDSTYNEVFVGRLAVAGGSPQAGCLPGWSESSPAGATPCHFQVTPGQKSAAQIRDELLAAINAIRGEAASCELALVRNDGTPGVPDPSKVNVLLTDAQGKHTSIPKDGANGWTYDDPAAPTAVILHGAACDALKAESSGKIEVELGCTTRVN